MFTNFFKYLVRGFFSLVLAIIIYGSIWDEFFFDNLIVLISGGELYSQENYISATPSDYVNPKYDKYEYPWGNGVAYHSLLSFNINMTKDSLNKISSTSFFIDGHEKPLVSLKFQWSSDHTGNYLKYYYSYFFNKERHYENTWYSCDGDSCRINLQLYNNYLRVLNGQEHDIKIIFTDGDNSKILEKNFARVYFPLDSDAEKVQYPKIELKHYSGESRFTTLITPSDNKSWAIIQWIDENGRSDKSIDLRDYNIGETIIIENKYSGKIKYLAALIYSDESLSEYKYEIINDDKI